MLPKQDTHLLLLPLLPRMHAVFKDLWFRVYGVLRAGNGLGFCGARFGALVRYLKESSAVLLQHFSLSVSSWVSVPPVYIKVDWRCLQLLSFRFPVVTVLSPC